MADSNFMRHNNAPFSENIYMFSDTRISDSAAVIRAISQWYNEKSKYNYNHPGYSISTGLF